MNGWHTPFRATLAWTGLLLPPLEARAEGFHADRPARDVSMAARAETWRGREQMTGEWAGVRERGSDRGLTVDGEWIGEVWANLAGGRSTGWVVEGLAQLHFDLDLERGFGWRGGSLRAGGILPHGESPTEELAGDLQGLSNIDAFRDEIAPYEVWWQQDFDDGGWSVRTGLLTADGEFACTDGGASMVNSGFGWPAGISSNTLNTGPAYFRSALGFRVRQVVDDAWHWQVGVFDGDTFDGDPAEDSVVDWSLGGDDGWFLIGEWARWRFGNDGGSGGTRVRIGCWWHTSFRDDPHDAAGRGGAYVAADLTLWSDRVATPEVGEAAVGDREGRRLSMFGRVEWAPGDDSSVEWSGDGGFLLEGLLPSRFDDALGVGVAWIRRSDWARSVEDDALVGEIALEVTWQWSLAPWWTLQPDYQWILNVGNGHGREAAHVIGLRTQLTF